MGPLATRRDCRSRSARHRAILRIRRLAARPDRVRDLFILYADRKLMTLATRIMLMKKPLIYKGFFDA
jgi:hypothetical protein